MSESPKVDKYTDGDIYNCLVDSFTKSYFITT